MTSREGTTTLDRFSRILVVDDCATVRGAVRLMLESLGHFNVEEAYDGTEALAKLERRLFQLVIFDWFMEPMPGIELLLRIRRSQRCADMLRLMVAGRPPSLVSI